MKTIYLVIIAAILLNGCVAYYPQVVDIPLIRKKGDIRVDAGYFLIPNINGSTNDSNDEGEFQPFSDAGFHATFSAGITDILAVQTYASVDGMFRVHLQGALGLYKGFENNTVIELYSGLGYGNGFGWWRVFNDAKDDYFLSFAQFNIGKTNMGAKRMDYGLGLKGGYMKTTSANIDFWYETIYKKNGWIIEPSVFFRFGGRRVKFCTKVNYLWTNSIIDEYYFPVSISMGVNLHLGKISKKEIPL